MIRLILVFLLSSPVLFAAPLTDGAFILTHPSKLYQTGPNLIGETNNYLKSFHIKDAQIIGLYQIPIEVDPLWYARPISYFTESYYSHGGEHDLQFPSSEKNSFTLYLSGGYLSACLGRTTSNLIYDFLRPEVKTKTLELKLLTKSIFTGYLEENGRLVPESPYWESILDDSIDGLSFFETVKLAPKSEIHNFYYETMDIALLQKSPLSNRYQEKDFNLIIKYDSKSFYLVKSNKIDSKNIVVSFIDAASF